MPTMSGIPLGKKLFVKLYCSGEWGEQPEQPVTFALSSLPPGDVSVEYPTAPGGAVEASGGSPY